MSKHAKRVERLETERRGGDGGRCVCVPAKHVTLFRFPGEPSPASPTHCEACGQRPSVFVCFVPEGFRSADIGPDGLFTEEADRRMRAEAGSTAKPPDVDADTESPADPNTTDPPATPVTPTPDLKPGLEIAPQKPWLDSPADDDTRHAGFGDIMRKWF